MDSRASRLRSGIGDTKMVFYEHADEASLVDAVALALAGAIEEDLARFSQCLLLLSGGTTPIPVYRALAPTLAERRGITVGLVDERWVDPQDPGSNARTLRESLLATAGAGVHFWPLAEIDAGLLPTVARANERLRTLSHPATVVLLGMGEDGHTASLFPGSPDLPRALASAEPYCALDASGCPGAGQWTQRISLTPQGWRDARRRLLVFRGARKRQVFQNALGNPDAMVLPVAAAIAVGAAPLVVHWCP